MIKLIRANFMRLKKDTLFWICVAFMFVLGFTVSVDIYIDKKDSATFCAENAAFGFTLFSGVLCAVFCGMFQGEELSDGTIRNKIISGHKRSDIYIS